MSVGLGGIFILAQPVAHAINTAGLPNGTYVFTTTGTAQLADPSGDCKSTGMVSASLDSNLFILTTGSDGKGVIQGQSGVAISVGSTNCPYPDYVTGTFTITGRDANSYRATGTFTQQPLSQTGSICSSTYLSNQPFTLIGDIKSNSFTIQTSGAGAGSVYAEGTNPGVLPTCTANIVNFVTSGKGTKNPYGF